ncbi:MAG: hypothetical protein PHR30_18775 [Gallionellaceae bacterium]|nr:hypothetical protein [Gallionellaceae bacterium]
MGISGLGSVTVIQLQDRGDPAAVDFTQADLTMDNTWRNLDLSAIIADPDASFVLLGLRVTDDTPGATLEFRKDGNANAVAIQGVVVQVDSVPIAGTLLVPIPATQIVEYRASEALAAVEITVLGWVA